MAALTAQQLDEVRADIMRRWSSEEINTPITKPELDALLLIVDVALNDAEVAVIAAIPGPHPGRQWLIDNQPIARHMLGMVEAKRMESL